MRDVSLNGREHYHDRWHERQEKLKNETWQVSRYDLTNNRPDIVEDFISFSIKEISSSNKKFKSIYEKCHKIAVYEKPFSKIANVSQFIVN